jgi:ubiquinone biosynthesis protein UbiJ
MSEQIPAVLETEDDFFLMANLSPRLTGLPFFVWISNRGTAQHDIRVKVSRGMKLKPGELISVALRPELRVIGDAAALSAGELQALRTWFELNFETLLDYWHGEIATDEALARLKAVEKR